MTSLPAEVLDREHCGSISVVLVMRAWTTSR